MKNFFGILFLFTLLYSCETPVAYIPPADELKDGYKRYSCRFVNDWRNNDVKYYFFDINLDKKIGLFNYATFYEGKKPKWNTSHYFTYIDNQKASFKYGYSVTTFYHKSGDLSNDGKIYARCSLWEDRSKVVVKTELKKKEPKKIVAKKTKAEKNVEEKTLEETLIDIFGDLRSSPFHTLLFCLDFVHEFILLYKLTCSRRNGKTSKSQNNYKIICRYHITWDGYKMTIVIYALSTESSGCVKVF